MKTIESSQTFQHFVGVDVGKETLVAQHFATRQLIEFPNTSDGTLPIFCRAMRLG